MTDTPNLAWAAMSCVHCGSPQCRYGACQLVHRPDSAYYVADRVCGSCGRHFEIGEKLHDGFVGMEGNNFVTVKIGRAHV